MIGAKVEDAIMVLGIKCFEYRLQMLKVEYLQKMYLHINALQTKTSLSSYILPSLL